MFQFAHVDPYALSASTLTGLKGVRKGEKRPGRETPAAGYQTASQRITGGGRSRAAYSAREILAEALREPQASRHVPHPAPPVQLYGRLEDLADELDQLDAEMKRARAEGLPSPLPKGMRKDTPIMLAGVLSAPWEPGDSRSAAWRADAVTWLKDSYGKNLRAVIAHEDEAYDHIHFYIAAPKPGPAKPLHAGHAAMAKAKAEGAEPKALTEAYKAAMRAWQDSYWENVGRRHGLLRTGPGRERLSRSEYKARKEAAARQARELAMLREEEEAQKRIRADTERVKALQAESAEALQRAATAIQVRRATVEERLAGAEARQQRLDAQAAQLAIREASVQAAERAVHAERVEVARTKRVVTALVDKARALVEYVWGYLTGMQRDEMNGMLRDLKTAEIEALPERSPHRPSGLDAPKPEPSSRAR